MAEETSGFQVKRLIRFEGEGTVKAYCDLAIGSLFLIRGLRIVQGKNGMFVSMPRQQGKDQKWYDQVSPLSKEVKNAVEEVVLAAYKEDDEPVNALV